MSRSAARGRSARSFCRRPARARTLTTRRTTTAMAHTSASAVSTPAPRASSRPSISASRSAWPEAPASWRARTSTEKTASSTQATATAREVESRLSSPISGARTPPRALWRRAAPVSSPAVTSAATRPAVRAVDQPAPMAVAGLADGKQGDASPDDGQGAHPHLVKPGVARLPAALGDRTGRLGQLVGDPLAGRRRRLGDAGRQPLARGEFVPLGQKGGHRAPVSLARSVRAGAARTATAVSALSCLVQRHGERRPFPPTYCQLTTDCCELCRTGRAGPASGPPGRADRQNVREILFHIGW